MDMVHSEQTLLNTYMKNRFIYKEKYVPEFEQRMQIFLGVKLKEPPTILPENPLSIKPYEKFITEKCNFYYTYKISCTKLINSYSEWLNRELTKYELIELKGYFAKIFVMNRISLEPKGDCKREKNVEGYWGVQLKTDPYGKYINSSGKKVVRINVETKKIVQSFKSLYCASDKLGINYKLINDKIKFQKIIRDPTGDYILQYK
jgi:hypothetical protein